jgi:hypothetical protein
MTHIGKFADDTKLGGKAITKQDVDQIQNDLNKIEEWARKWQMNFNVDKCKVMHVGRSNHRHDYHMGGQPLAKVTDEKDLGIIICSDLKPSKQCTAAANKANKMLGMIKRNITYKTKYNVLKLYNAFVRPHLEYCIQFWSPYLRKDVIKLEKVQRRATKMIPTLRNKSYEERLLALNLFSLEQRRSRGDMIEVWKILNGRENIDMNELLTLDESSITRTNGFKLVRRRFAMEVARNSFGYRVISE